MTAIYSITEAFSMQPSALYVGMHLDLWKTKVAQILKETIVVDGVEREVFVGYGEQGQKLFQYFVNTVNVHYYSPA